MADVPDHLWNAAVKGWRETAERQMQMDMQRAELARQAIEPVVEGMRRGGQVVSALFGDRQHVTDPEVGRVDRYEIDRRMQRTQADIQRNLDAARASGYPEAMAGAWPAAAGGWVGRVQEGGQWDDKRRDKKLERQGNYSYGATAAALGVPEEIALRAAGAVQRLSNVAHALGGGPLNDSVGFLHAPYGDDPRDQVPISQGYAYGRAHARRR